MNKLEDLYTLVGLLKNFELPISPILEFAIKEKEEQLLAGNSEVTGNELAQAKTPALRCIIEPISYTSVKEEFYQYLYDTKAAQTARNYYSYIDKQIRVYINKLIDSEADSVYSFRTVAEIRACIQKLKANNEFIENNARMHNALTASTTSYLKFLEMKEKL